MSVSLSWQQVKGMLENNGYTIARHKFTSNYLKNILDIDTVIDIGVGHGTPPLHDKEIASNFVLIDPQPVPPPVVEMIESFGGTVHCFQTALGDQREERTFYVHANMNHSNLHQHTSTFSKLESAQASEATTPVVPLDDLLEENKLELGRYAVKIDTEGSELAVIRGATKTLRNAAFVLIETSVKRRFQGAYKPSAIIAELAQLGLEPADFLNISLKTPWYIDILFAPWSSDIFDVPK